MFIVHLLKCWRGSRSCVGMLEQSTSSKARQV